MPPRGFEAVSGGFFKRDVPPPDWQKPDEPFKRGIPYSWSSVASLFSAVTNTSPTKTAQLAHREAPETVTSTTWVTTDNCQPTRTPAPEDEYCDEDDALTDGSSASPTVPLPSTSSGMLSEATSSADGGLVSHAPEPSEAHVGE